MTPQNIVVKVGSSVLTQPDLRLDRGVFCALVGEVAKLVSDGHRVTLVSSGAVATGRRKLGISLRPQGSRAIPTLQALAAVGQARLIQLYDSEFAHYGLHVAQLLLTRDDINARGRYLNARHTFAALAELGAVAIVNENDTVASDELRFGDNDQLAALVATMVRADILIILSDVDGIYSDDPHRHPRATRISEMRADDARLDAMVGGPHDTVGGVGTGGMKTKLTAARLAAGSGIVTVIGLGKQPGLLDAALMRAPECGTILLPAPNLEPKSARKTWIGVGVQTRGRVWCDPGAAQALTRSGGSLLPSGVTRVEGHFAEGAAVELMGPDDALLGRGLAVYDADALRLIAGRQSGEIESILGYKILDAAFHRDDMVITRVP